MSLREEIKEYLHNIEPNIKSLLDKDIHVWNIQVTDNIVSMIEKRIDVLKQEKVKELQFQDKADEQFFINCMEMTKKEMLK